MDEVLYSSLNKIDQKLCVLATTTLHGHPHASAMKFIVQKDLSIILSTHKGTKKYDQLKSNKQVALTFGLSFSEPYVQYEGEAKLIESGSEYEELDKLYFQEHPENAKFRGKDLVFIHISPSWVRHTDFSSHPPTTQEQSY